MKAAAGRASFGGSDSTGRPSTQGRRPPLMAHHFRLPRELAARGGPRPTERAAFQGWLDETAALVRADRLSPAAVHDFWRSLGPRYMQETVQGQALLKPHGYPGDFMIMERIHSGHISVDPSWRGWDAAFQAAPAARAVRNRVPYFKQLVHELARARSRPLRILDLGSGPSRIVIECLRALPGAIESVTCVDHDPRALVHAAHVCADHAARVRFVAACVLAFDPDETYDLVWAAGVFDYFSSRRFVTTLRRLAGCVRPAGEIVIGNFSPHNPSRNYMELVGDWRLHHRHAAELRSIAGEAGFASDQVRVDAEPEGVNLFLRVRSTPKAGGLT